VTGGLARLAALVAPPLVVLSMASAAAAARGPTPVERAGIRQAIFDSRAARPPAGGLRVGKISVSTRGPRFPAPANFYYRVFAVAVISAPNVTPAAVLLGYYVAPLSGWRVLDLGTSNVGCGLPATLFHGYKLAVLNDLRLTCP
jgi:hypothetical protein